MKLNKIYLEPYEDARLSEYELVLGNYKYDEGNNKLFSGIFPKQEDVHKGAICYSESTANDSQVDDSAINFYPFSPNQTQLEAQQVVQIIQKSTQENPDRSISILVRNRSHLSDIVIALKQHNISFEALKIAALKDNLFTKDLLSLTKALLHLGDKLAWLSILRAPWCGLLLKDLLMNLNLQTHCI